MENERGATDNSETEQDEPGIMERLVEGARGSGVGTEDPNIVGDITATDAPPGRDPDPGWPPEGTDVEDPGPGPLRKTESAD